MERHKRIYLEFFGYVADFPCEAPGCNQWAVDIHHIDRRSNGNSKSKDYIENLAGLCRKCHKKAGFSREFNEEVKRAHLKLIETYGAIKNQERNRQR